MRKSRNAPWGWILSHTSLCSFSCQHDYQWYETHGRSPRTQSGLWLHMLYVAPWCKRHFSHHYHSREQRRITNVDFSSVSCCVREVSRPQPIFAAFQLPFQRLLWRKASAQKKNRNQLFSSQCLFLSILSLCISAPGAKFPGVSSTEPGDQINLELAEIDNYSLFWISQFIQINFKCIDSAQLSSEQRKLSLSSLLHSNLRIWLVSEQRWSLHGLERFLQLHWTANCGPCDLLPQCRPSCCYLRIKSNSCSSDQHKLLLQDVRPARPILIHFSKQSAKQKSLMLSVHKWKGIFFRPKQGRGKRTVSFNRRWASFWDKDGLLASARTLSTKAWHMVRGHSTEHVG